MIESKKQVELATKELYISFRKRIETSIKIEESEMEKCKEHLTLTDPDVDFYKEKLELHKKKKESLEQIHTININCEDNYELAKWLYNDGDLRSREEQGWLCEELREYYICKHTDFGDELNNAYKLYESAMKWKHFIALFLFSARIMVFATIKFLIDKIDCDIESAAILLAIIWLTILYPLSYYFVKFLVSANLKYNRKRIYKKYKLWKGFLAYSDKKLDYKETYVYDLKNTDQVIEYFKPKTEDFFRNCKRTWSKNGFIILFQALLTVIFILTFLFPLACQTRIFQDWVLFNLDPSGCWYYNIPDLTLLWFIGLWYVPLAWGLLCGNIIPSKGDKLQADKLSFWTWKRKVL